MSMLFGLSALSTFLNKYAEMIGYARHVLVRKVLDVSTNGSDNFSRPEAPVGLYHVCLFSSIAGDRCCLYKPVCDKILSEIYRFQKSFQHYIELLHVFLVFHPLCILTSNLPRDHPRNNSFPSTIVWFLLVSTRDVSHKKWIVADIFQAFWTLRCERNYW
jgi:hypothetical protein